MKWGAAVCIEAEEWYGPFDTIEDAIAKAAELDESGGGGAICDCAWPDACEYVTRAIDLFDLLERMDELAIDDGHYDGDGPLFEPLEGAAHALEGRLRQWAVQYLTANSFTAKNPRPARTP